MGVCFSLVKKIIFAPRRYFNYLREFYRAIFEIKKQNEELLFAHLFADSRRDCRWLKDKSFSPFQGAANYSFLYKLFRIYDIIKPQSILEFGLGQTSKLTCQYLKYSNRRARAIIVDDNQQWLEVYRRQLPVSKNLKLVKLETQSFRHAGRETANSRYANLAKKIKKQKFDLIIIDGPIGYGKFYPRTNILDLVPHLAKQFIVVFDDAEREGEQRTMKLFAKKLEAASIPYQTFNLPSVKMQTYFCDRKSFNLVFAI
jgi:hypothetical protein